jgi:hypothetical protein
MGKTLDLTLLRRKGRDEARQDLIAAELARLRRSTMHAARVGSKKVASHWRLDDRFHETDHGTGN